MPVSGVPDMRLPPPDKRARLDFMPGSTVPVIRQPFMEGDPMPYWSWGDFVGDQLFDLIEDPDEEHNLATGPLAKDGADLLQTALSEMDAPDDQFVRLGLR
jgi:hypothetical protein